MLVLNCGRYSFVSFFFTPLLLSFHAFQNYNKVDVCFCQVKSGTLFDNVLVADDPEYAKTLAEETWGKQKDVCASLYFNFFFSISSFCHIWLMLLFLQAEKAAFEEAEKKREEEVFS